MGKLPWAKFFYADFIQDTDVLSLEGVGGWIRVLCQMWHKNNGILEVSIKQLSQLLRTDEITAKRFLYEIKENDVANVNITGPNKKITIISRRISKEKKNRENNRLRQERYQTKKRNNGVITPQKSEDKKSEDKKSDLKNKTLVERKELFETQFWGTYPKRNGKKLNKADALKEFLKLSKKEAVCAVLGVKLFDASRGVKEGIGIPDAFRWLKKRSFMDWQTPDDHESKKETGLDRMLREEEEKENDS